MMGLERKISVLLIDAADQKAARRNLSEGFRKLARTSMERR
jgi:hypothetical protein